MPSLPLFSFYIYFMASHSALRRLINRQRKDRREKEISTVHELPYTEIVKSKTIKLASGPYALKCSVKEKYYEKS